MKIKYVGPHGLVEVAGVGIFEFDIPVDIDDETAKTLMANGAFKKIESKKEVK